MIKLRAILQDGRMGWIVAGVAVIAAIYFLVRSLGSDGPYDPRRLQQEVLVRFTDTGDELRLPRGRFETMLRESGRQLKPDEGLVNPKTGKPTGVLVAESEWTETVARLNAERDQVKDRSPWGKR